MARYCATADEISFPQLGEWAWGPASVRALDPKGMLGSNSLSITRDGADVGLGGGFHPWGYRLGRDNAASTPATDVWSLFLRDDENPEKLLFTFKSPKSDKMSRADFIAEAMRGFDAWKKRFPDDPEEGKEEASFVAKFGVTATKAAGSGANTRGE